MTRSAGILILSLGVLACGPQRSLIGVWKVAEVPYPGVTEMTMEFSGDGSFSTVAKLGTGIIAGTASAKGTWSADGSTLTVSVKETTFEKIPEDFQGFIKDALEKEANRLSGPFRWVDDKTVEVGSEGNLFRMTRQ